MNYRQRWAWLSQATGEDTVRGVARTLAVSHTSVQRWLQKGTIPAATLISIVVRFNQDPLEATVVWGLLRDEDVPALNWATIAQYVPADVLTAELHNRARTYVHANYPDTLRKLSVWDAPALPNRPSLSDALERRSFRLTSK